MSLIPLQYHNTLYLRYGIQKCPWNDTRDSFIYRITSSMILKRHERHFYLPYHKYYDTETVWETFLSSVSQVLCYWNGIRYISIYRITSIMILKRYETHFYLPYHKYYDTEAAWGTFLSTISQVLWYWSGMRNISLIPLQYHNTCDTVDRNVPHAASVS
jgi:hypothetical protein